MASALFEISNIYDPEDRVDGTTCCYRCILVVFSVLLGGTGGTILIKAIFIRSLAATLHSISPLADVIWHTTHSTIAAGAFMTVTGVVGTSCTSVEGLILYFVLTVLSMMLEIGVGSALITVQNEILTYASLSGKCEECKLFSDDVKPLLPTTSGLFLCFAICQVFILYLVIQFIAKLRNNSDQALVPNRSCRSNYGSRRDYPMTRMGQSSKRVGHRNLELILDADRNNQHFSSHLYTPHRSDASSSLPGSSTPKDQSCGSTMRLSHSMLSAVTPSTIRSNRSQQVHFRTPFFSRLASRGLIPSSLCGADAARKKNAAINRKVPEIQVSKIADEGATCPCGASIATPQGSGRILLKPKSPESNPPTASKFPDLDQAGAIFGSPKSDVTSGDVKDGGANSMIQDGVFAEINVLQSPGGDAFQEVCLNETEYTPEVERCGCAAENSAWVQGIPLTPTEFPETPVTPPPPPPPTPSSPSPPVLLMPLLLTYELTDKHYETDE